MYIIGVVLFPLYKKWPRLRSLSPYIGLPIVAVAVIAASFASKVWHLILTQGVMYGIGGAIVYYPTLLFLDEWFIRRKGFAFGIMWVRNIPVQIFKLFIMIRNPRILTNEIAGWYRCRRSCRSICALFPPFKIRFSNRSPRLGCNCYNPLHPPRLLPAPPLTPLYNTPICTP